MSSAKVTNNNRNVKNPMYVFTIYFLFKVTIFPNSHIDKGRMYLKTFGFNNIRYYSFFRLKNAPLISRVIIYIHKTFDMNYGIGSRN